MKNLQLCTLFVVGLFLQNAIAQKPPMGIYLTQSDYLNHKLSYVTQEGNIRLNNMFKSSNIVVNDAGTKKVLMKKDIFGYRSENTDYRFFNNQAYKIVDGKDFYIYTHPILVPDQKGLKSVTAYYFSPKVTDSIEALTKGNVEAAYAQNTKFRYMVEGQFRSDDDLAAYDTVIKSFKIKYLYAESTK